MKVVKFSELTALLKNKIITIIKEYIFPGEAVYQ
jgi:hypothetical protein